MRLVILVNQFICIASLMLFLASENINAANKNQLVYCAPLAPEGFDTALYINPDSQDSSSNLMFNRLVATDPQTGTVFPELAQSWVVSDNGLEYVFTLEKGVKFHRNTTLISALKAINEPQELFSADDVLFSFNRLLDKNNFYNKALPQTYIHLELTNFKKNIIKIEKIGTHKVKFILKERDNNFLFQLGTGIVSIHSEQYARGLVALMQPEKLNHNPIGTGPFILQNYQKDVAIKYRANPNYFKGEVELQSLIFLITPDSAARVQKLLSGECDLINAPPFTSLKLLAAKPNLTIDDIPALLVTYTYLNVKNFVPFQDIRVRNALSFAIDRDAIVKNIFQGSGIAAGNVMSITSPTYDSSIRPRVVDLERARDLLKEAGYENGFKMELWTTPLQLRGQVNGRLLAEMLQNDWAKIGIQATIKVASWNDYVRSAQSGAYDGAIIMSASGTLSPDSFVSWFSCSRTGVSNFSRWCSSEFDQLLYRARRALSETEALSLYRQSQQLIDRETPVIPLVYPTSYTAYHKKVKNFQIRSDGLLFFDSIYIDN